MTYLTEVVPLGNPWEAGLDVSLVFPRREVSRTDRLDF